MKDAREATEEQTPSELGSPAPHAPADASGSKAKLRRRRPADTLLAHQLEVAVPTGYQSEIRTAMLNSAFDLYSALDPQDGVDSLLARQIVALNNFVMESLWVGTTLKSSWTVHYVALAMKGAQIMADLLKFYDGRRAAAARTHQAQRTNTRLAKPKARARLSAPLTTLEPVQKPRNSNGRASSN